MCDADQPWLADADDISMLWFTHVPTTTCGGLVVTAFRDGLDGRVSDSCMSCRGGDDRRMLEAPSRFD